MTVDVSNQLAVTYADDWEGLSDDDCELACLSDDELDDFLKRGDVSSRTVKELLNSMR